jgi:hypothetical protein
MARPGITYSDIKSAADELLKSGISPSIQRLREYLGTGSNTTIATYLKQWQQELVDQPKAIRPPAVPEELMNALEKFWQVALAKSEQAYQEVKEKAEQSVEHAEKDRNEATAAMQLARSEAESLHQRLQETQTQLSQIEKTLLVEQERRDLAEAEIEVAEQRAAEAWQATEKIRDETKQQIAQLEKVITVNREELQQRLIEADQRLKHERERGEAAESRLLQLIDKLRNEQREGRGACSCRRCSRPRGAARRPARRLPTPSAGRARDRRCAHPTLRDLDPTEGHHP